jgi:hypothetical protein
MYDCLSTALYPFTYIGRMFGFPSNSTENLRKEPDSGIPVVKDTETARQIIIGKPPNNITLKEQIAESSQESKLSKPNQDQKKQFNSLKGRLEDALKEVLEGLQKLDVKALPEALKGQEIVNGQRIEETIEQWPKRLTALKASFEKTLSTLSPDTTTGTTTGGLGVNISSPEDIAKLSSEIDKLREITKEVIQTFKLIKGQPEFAQKSLLVAIISTLLTCFGATLALLSHLMPFIAPLASVIGPSISITSALGGLSFQIRGQEKREYLEAWQAVIDSLNNLKKVALGDEKMMAVLADAYRRLENKVDAQHSQTNQQLQAILEQNRILKEQNEILKQENECLEAAARNNNARQSGTNVSQIPKSLASLTKV